MVAKTIMAAALDLRAASTAVMDTDLTVSVVLGVRSTNDLKVYV